MVKITPQIAKMTISLILLKFDHIYVLFPTKSIFFPSHFPLSTLIFLLICIFNSPKDPT